MADKSDKVGYGRPPVHSRFKPGQSGNPPGRPKGTLNFTTDLKRTLQAPVTLNDGRKTRRVTTQEAALLRLAEKALKGDPKSSREAGVLVGHAQRQQSGVTIKNYGCRRSGHSRSISGVDPE